MSTQARVRAIVQLSGVFGDDPRKLGEISEILAFNGVAFGEAESLT